MILCISVLSVVISPFSFLILLIWFFSLCFLRCACIAMNFPLRTAFGLLCFHFHSFLCTFWFLFWFLLWFVGYSAWESLCCLLKWTKQNTESCLNYDFNCCCKSNTKVCFSPCEVEPSQVMTNTVLHFRLLQDLLKQCLLGNVHCLVVLTILIVLGIFSNKCFRTGVPVEYIFLKSVWLTEAVN